MLTKENIAESYRDLQKRIIGGLESADGQGSFETDTWERPGGGGGISRVIRNGRIIEKGGVNFSEVYGETPDNILRSMDLPKADFFATGVSIVLHPKNPMVPIIHMNVRYFEMTSGHWWFGGGIDLTPHYVNREDARYFHQSLKDVCDRYDSGYYPKFKKWADDYFYLKHREETRGIGGIFFDRLDGNKTHIHDFTIALGDLFAPLYAHFMKKNHEIEYGEKEVNWQRLRRGRYVEFNLVWDRGTKFGLETNGRTESILMSLPPLAGWEYNAVPESGSREHKTLQLLKKDINWLSE
ncbi:oxygen-dependent coproporphyrinogen oxidase [Fulvivirga sedimenti]|uniref:coproporphyrinogen oxidase n=1 Tax=Fulvivirga sedimenti TaxID=2879465 RepID=A0A9X1HN33_9BACT|nr:oxygen-dependent coproporphyrinogen oxidase [Fulvivirga sedimenti]MCA6074955.1 oxygen-dependent coproporphyrinogen oxidase [Fulvivirga sedimenti]MCA6076132.1 oxygen-dependent coproporphyrinogen oxidase [Fulvivirga sedimenti]MCA6077260.1 oxygen-dependent coproporphyrinogen oxidase [Fulvivirga sedimenti]